MDKMGADFTFSFDSIGGRLGANAVAVQIPIGSGNTFEGLVDLLTMKAYYFSAEELGAKVEERDIPEALTAEARKWRHDLVEKAAEMDEALTEKFIMEQSISADEVRCALRTATIARKICPIFCGSALKISAYSA